MENKKNNFSLIVSVLTLAFMTIGTTFAFFSSVIKNDEEVDVSAANYKLGLKVSPLYNEKKIIPTNDEDIFVAFENRCIDDQEYGACYAYNIEMHSEGETQDILGKIRVPNEGFTNLKYMILDANKKDEDGNYVVYKEMDYVSQEYEMIGDAITLESGQSKNYILVIWLSNLNEKQNEETGKTFSVEMSINSTMGTKITGTISADVSNS